MFLTDEQTQEFLDVHCCPKCGENDWEEDIHPTGNRKLRADITVKAWECVDCGTKVTIVWSKDGVSGSLEYE